MRDKILRKSVHRSFLKKADEVLPKFFDKAVQEGERSAIQRFLALLAGKLVGVSANAMTVMKKMKASEVLKARKTERGYVIYISYLINPNGKRFFGEARVPVNSQTYGIMKSWLEARKDIPGWSSEFFFSSNTGEGVNTSLLLAQFKRIWVELGLPKPQPTFEDLRTSIAEHALMSVLDIEMTLRMAIFMYYDVAASEWFFKDDYEQVALEEVVQDDLPQEEEEEDQEDPPQEDDDEEVEEEELEEEGVQEDPPQEEVVKEELVEEEEEEQGVQEDPLQEEVNSQEEMAQGEVVQEEVVKEEVNSQKEVMEEEVVEEEVVQDDLPQEEVNSQEVVAQGEVVKEEVNVQELVIKEEMVEEEVVHEEEGSSQEEGSSKEEVKWNRRRLRKRAVNQEEVNSQEELVKEEVNSQEVVIKEQAVEEEVVIKEERVEEEVVKEEEGSSQEEVKWSRRRLMKREFHQEENSEEEEEVKNKILRTRVSVLLSPLTPRTMRRWTGRRSHQGRPAGVP
ncbi:probable inactive protein kinase DDB_G0270444 [Engraulis encrasicolus]|uniref:probable inactive protein kinase DDB_G0270444 n=1 Tax=Engraulis encrasicolus TaxID=184585 RepID=UPI002FD69515